MATSHALNKELRNQAEQMARDGKPISKIQETLHVDYDEIWTYLNSIGAYSWIGAKSITTRRSHPIRMLWDNNSGVDQAHYKDR